jgi:hypothetical protein
MAAYRPIIFDVQVTRTDGTPVPPVVYCDIYFNGTYYKTISNTQYLSLESTYSTFRFDIQDAVQEFLSVTLPANGGSVIVSTTTNLVSLYCMFRSSGFDSNGFIVSENTAPVQGTSSSDPVAGTGTQSNTCFAVNATLQQKDNQDLQLHLNSFKKGIWATGLWPLSHRPHGYKICRTDSDYFPAVNIGSSVPNCIKLFYRLKGQSTFQEIDNCCTIVSYTGVLAPAMVGQVWTTQITLNGTGPFTFNIGTGNPSWLSGSISGNILTLTGTPTTSGNVTISFSVSNCGGSQSFSQSMTVAPATSCIAPVLNSATNIGTGTILNWSTGSWNAITVQWSYDLVTWNDSTGTPTSPIDFSYSGSGIASGRTVYFRVVGQCTAGASLPSNVISVNT